MDAPLGLLSFLLLQSVVVCVVFIVVYDMVQRVLALDRVSASAASVFVFSLIGYACFWIAYCNYTLFGVLKIALLCCFAIYFAVLVYRRTLLARLG